VIWKHRNHISIFTPRGHCAGLSGAFFPHIPHPHGLARVQRRRICSTYIRCIEHVAASVDPPPAGRAPPQRVVFLTLQRILAQQQPTMCAALTSTRSRPTASTSLYTAGASSKTRSFSSRTTHVPCVSVCSDLCTSVSTSKEPLPETWRDLHHGQANVCLLDTTEWRLRTRLENEGRCAPGSR
jgi:hypothetical protein